MRASDFTSIDEWLLASTSGQPHDSKQSTRVDAGAVSSVVCQSRAPCIYALRSELPMAR